MIRVGRALPISSGLSKHAAKKQHNPGEVFGIILDKEMRAQGGKGLYGIDKGQIQRPLPIKERDADSI